MLPRRLFSGNANIGRHDNCKQSHGDRHLHRLRAAGTTALSALTSALAVNTIDNAAYGQTGPGTADHWHGDDAFHKFNEPPHLADLQDTAIAGTSTGKFSLLATPPPGTGLRHLIVDDATAYCYAFYATNTGSVTQAMRIIFQYQHLGWAVGISGDLASNGAILVYPQPVCHTLYSVEFEYGWPLHP